MDFSAAIEAQLAGRTVRRARLVWFDFLSGPMGVWNGFGTLKTGGRTWHGLAGLGSVSGIEQAIDGAAPEMRFTVSGVDADFAAKARAEAPEYYMRSVTCFSQFMDDQWQNLDAPFAEAWGLMHSMISSRESDGDNGFLRTVTITAETPFAGKKRPRFAYCTDADQKQRFPGDRFFDRVAGIESKTIRFPT